MFVVASFIDIISSLGVAYLAYHQTKKHPVIVAAIAAVATWYILRLLRTQEQFAVLTGTATDGTASMYPYTQVPTGGAEGDLTLTNLYRRLHNLDSIQRSDIFQFNDALAGGSYNIPVEPYVGAAYDREMMKIKQTIREDIAAKRRGYNELLDTPTKPVFITVGPGDDRILGIPSQVGSLPYYY
jgi:hypothetical protein